MASHVLRHFLPDSVLRVYDIVGMIALLGLVYFGGRYLDALLAPFMDIFRWALYTL